MRTKTIVTIVAVAVLMIAVPGCEDSELTAPTDGVLNLAANPSNVTFNPNDPNAPRDPNTGELIARSTMIAQVFDADGVPQENISVLFTTTGGSLASSPGGSAQSVRTNANGIATDVLTLTESDSAALEQVEVSARSSSLSDTVTIFLNEISPDAPATAIIDITPFEGQGVGRPVIFNGDLSNDPDGSPITMYRWTVNSTNADPSKPDPEILEGEGISAFERSYTNVQELTVTLEVSSDPGAAADLAAGRPVAYSSDSDIVIYPIFATFCQDTDNRAPTATIAGPDSITTPLPSGGTGASILLDGSLSSDPDGRIIRYVWSCGNSTQPTVLPGIGCTTVETCPKVVCRYGVGTATATLQVQDNGTGSIDPVTGTWRCQKTSQRDEVTITVTPP